TPVTPGEWGRISWDSPVGEAHIEIPVRPEEQVVRPAAVRDGDEDPQERAGGRTCRPLILKDLGRVRAAHIQVAVRPERNAARVAQAAGTSANEDCTGLAGCGQGRARGTIVTEDDVLIRIADVDVAVGTDGDAVGLP